MKTKSLEGFEYIPSLKLYISKKKKFYEKTWIEAHEKLQENEERMPTILEFIEFLKYARTNLPNTYNEITELRNPWRAELLDAGFNVKNNKLHIYSNHILNSTDTDEDNTKDYFPPVIPKNSEILQEDTLMKNKKISLEDYILNNHTSQGLPSLNVKSGKFHYESPGYINSPNSWSVSWFGTYNDYSWMACTLNPFHSSEGLGVRAVREK